MDLPLNNQEPVPEGAVAIRTPGVDARARRIVVLDDCHHVSEAIKAAILFRWPELLVLTFNCVEEALQDLERQPPDLFTTDITHPGTPTLEILQRLAEQKASYPIFVISAFLEALPSREVQQFVKQGLRLELLSKPFLADDLWRMVAKHLRLPMEPLAVKERPRPRLP